MLRLLFFEAIVKPDSIPRDIGRKSVAPIDIHEPILEISAMELGDTLTCVTLLLALDAFGPTAPSGLIACTAQPVVHTASTTDMK